MTAALTDRVAALEAAFRHIAATRMDGVPILHPGLRVQAVGFEPDPTDAGIALGVLVTPWFMNMMRLPLAAAAPVPKAAADPAPIAGVGLTATRAVGPAHRMDFIGGFEDAIGAYEACSLFSPMHEFTDHAAAVATAAEVLRLLRQPPAAAAAASRPASAPAPAPAGPPANGVAVPSRRAFLAGRPAPEARR